MTKVGRGLWVRYGGEPITRAQIEFAAQHYAVALVQPREREAARQLKELNPDIVVLAYKCLSSARKYEESSPYTSGVSYAEAEKAEAQGYRWFARRLNGEKIEWSGYWGHYQMRVWDASYRSRWVQNVVAEIADSPFDGVMADNDIYGDYYGLNLPIEEADSIQVLHRGLDALIAEAGSALNAHGKILVPNIAESRRDKGKWERHSAYGGGFEEVFLGWGPQDYLDAPSSIAQIQQMAPSLLPSPSLELELQRFLTGNEQDKKLTLLRTATNGDILHPNFLMGLAAFWIFGGGQWSALTAGAQDEHNDTPWVDELAWDLGRPTGPIEGDQGIYSRGFENGWAAVNLTNETSPMMNYPGGLQPPGLFSLPPHQGMLARMEEGNLKIARRF